MTANLYRGTTPTIILHIKDEDFDLSTITECHLTIENDSGRNKKTFVVDNSDIDPVEKTITITLSQQDTSSFEEGVIVLQLKVKLNDNTVVASKIISTTMNRILEENVI